MSKKHVDDILSYVTLTQHSMSESYSKPTTGPGLALLQQQQEPGVTAQKLCLSELLPSKSAPRRIYLFISKTSMSDMKQLRINRN